MSKECIQQPARKYRIGIILNSIGTQDINSEHVAVHGDEQIALCWKKYLERYDEVDSITLMGPKHDHGTKLDIMIHFDPFLEPYPCARNILYMQNAFSKHLYKEGTQGVFKEVRDKYDAFIFPSGKLMKLCAPGAVIPFAADPETLFPQFDERFTHPVSFLGNPIRGPLIEYRYIAPAIPFGLAIYSMPSWPAPFYDSWRGGLPAHDMAKLYNSSLINLNAHIDEHLEAETINLRVFDILACEGFVISDPMDSLEDLFEGAVVLTHGYEDEWAKITYYLSDTAERVKKKKLGRQVVLRDHTYASRMETLIKFLKEI